MEHISNLLPKSSKTVSADHLDEPVYECQICKDAGFIHPLDDGGKADYSRVVPCECRRERIKEERNQRLIRLCDLPYATEGLTFENFERDKSLESLEAAYEAALELAEESGDLKWLTLMGDVDVGKTHLAIAICRRWLERGKPARYVFTPLMLDELRRGYSPDAERTFDAQFEFLMNVPLLVLDDLGAQRATEWAIEKLETIIDYRYTNGLPLVVTTNRPIDNFSFRIASRLRRFSVGKVIVIDAPEFHLRKGVRQK